MDHKKLNTRPWSPEASGPFYCMYLERMKDHSFLNILLCLADGFQLLDKNDTVFWLNFNFSLNKKTKSKYQLQEILTIKVSLIFTAICFHQYNNKYERKVRRARNCHVGQLFTQWMNKCIQILGIQTSHVDEICVVSFLVNHQGKYTSIFSCASVTTYFPDIQIFLSRHE